MRDYLIPQTDLRVSRIAFGCDRITPDGVLPDDLTDEDVSRAARLVNVAHASGMTLFDTAAGYGSGSSEVVLGRVLALSPGLRHQVVIQTKFWGHDRASVVASVETSLTRLGTDYLDILLIHTQHPLLELDELAEAFSELHHSGKVRYFGVSNHSPTRIELIKRHVGQPLVVNQFQLGLGYLDSLDELPFNVELGTYRFTRPYTPIAGVDYSRLNDMQVQAYSPLRGASVFGPAGLLERPSDVPPSLRKAAQALHEVAEARNTSPAVIALAWLLRHPGRILPIIGSKREENIVACAAADDLDLTPGEWTTLWRSAVEAGRD